jgi:cardiolipin synthase
MPWLHVNVPPTAQDIACYPSDDTSRALITLSDAVTRRPLVSGNRVEILHNGEQAYPAMLDAIRNARESVFLSSYIFAPDSLGMQFVRELISAADRGVDVRILIDAFGEFYSRGRVRRHLRGTKVKVVSFLPPRLLHSLYFNLRNHRKLLVIDNRIGFTGGINIRERHLVAAAQDSIRVIDIHFRLQGPVCEQLRDAFMEDWHYATKEKRKPRQWPRPATMGDACCRGISAGPNEPHEKLNWIIIGALSCATSHIRIMTPYFIPSRAQLAAINVAALRGVRVEIILPAQNNLPFVGWAANAYLFEVLEHDARVYFHPPPFVHSKLLLIDDKYALIGSANIDPRSLRLNFEFNVEVFDQQTVAELSEHFDRSRDRSRQMTLKDVDSRPLATRLRDSFFKLFSPYL